MFTDLLSEICSLQDRLELSKTLKLCLDNMSNHLADDIQEGNSTPVFAAQEVTFLGDRHKLTRTREHGSQPNLLFAHATISLEEYRAITTHHFWEDTRFT